MRASDTSYLLTVAWVRIPYLQLVLDGGGSEDLQIPLDGLVHLVEFGVPVLQGEGGVVVSGLPVVELLLSQVPDAQQKGPKTLSGKFLKDKILSS